MRLVSGKVALAAAMCSLFGLMGCNTTDSDHDWFDDVVVKDGKLVDPRDGNEYGVALIGGYYWMTENLRYADSNSMRILKDNSWCYNNDKKECEKHGRLYSWTAANAVCPPGWTLPTSIMWTALMNAVDSENGDEGVGTSLKSLDGWDKSDSAAAPTNRFGFNAKASGRRNNDGETFLSTGKNAFFWSSVEKDKGTAFGWNLRNDLDLLQEGNFYKDHGLSVRCAANTFAVRVTGPLDSSYIDKIPHSYGSLKYEGETYKTVKIGGLEWMAENLNYNAEGSHCYKDEKDNCKEFGRLYSYKTAKTVCPDGWHLPTGEDVSSLKGNIPKSKLLRSTSGWSDKASKGLNFWGFNAKPAGGKDSGDYFDMKTSAYFWVDSGESPNDASVLWINYYDEAPSIVKHDAKKEFSVRCVKDK